MVKEYNSFVYVIQKQGLVAKVIHCTAEAFFFCIF